MIQLGGRLFSLLAAVALTFIATATLTGLGGVADVVWPAEINVPPSITTIECLCFGPPPRLPKFLHPARRVIRPPDIVCESPPGDPDAVTDCSAPAESK